MVAVAHGTRSHDGIAEIQRLGELVRQARPDVRVELCWLELASPLLRDVLAEIDGPVVVVPLLLSTGYHVKTDITSVVGRRPDTAVAGQLGPEPRLTGVVRERLLASCAESAHAEVVLFASGSSDPEAAENLAEVAAQLERSTGVPVHPRFLPDSGWRDGVPDGARVANYLLAPGYFNDQLQSFGRQLGSSCIAAPIGAHPAVAAVALDRYDQAAWTLASHCRHTAEPLG